MLYCQPSPLRSVLQAFWMIEDHMKVLRAVLGHFLRIFYSTTNWLFVTYTDFDILSKTYMRIWADGGMLCPSAKTGLFQFASYEHKRTVSPRIRVSLRNR
jgi:hypothetical protein